MDNDQLQRYCDDLVVFLASSAIVLPILLLVASCAGLPPNPPPGPQQKTAAGVHNPSCGFMCFVEVSQSTALEDIKNNTGPVTGGAQSKSNTQSQSGTLSPTGTLSTTETKLNKAKDD